MFEQNKKWVVEIINSKENSIFTCNLILISNNPLKSL
jgi:hypothetical protein